MTNNFSDPAQRYPIDEQFYQRNLESVILFVGGIFGVFGNSQIFWLIQTKAELRFKSSLIVSYLALSDLCFSLSFIASAAYHWATELGLLPPPTALSCFWASILPRNFFMQASLCLMLCVAVDRYAQLRVPLRYFQQSQRRYLRLVKGGTLVLTSLVPFITFPFINTEEDFQRQGSYCEVLFVLKRNFVMAYLPMGAIPSVAIVALYAGSLKWLRRRLREQRQRRNNHKVAERTLMYQKSVRLVVIVFILSWMNMVVGSVVRGLLQSQGLLTQNLEAFWNVYKVSLYVGNAVLNYPIYYSRNPAYRKEFRKMLRLDSTVTSTAIAVYPFDATPIPRDPVF